MNYLLIENKGEIDVNALTLMGGSTKRSDNQSIGFFGSGNKYAIALLLKNNIPLRIFSGEEEIIISTTPVQFRESSFNKILFNGRETSLTTDMGPQWETWMAVREVLSNSIDEGGSNVINNTSTLSGKNGFTRFYIGQTPEIQDVVDNWDNYFTFDRTDALLDCAEGKIFPIKEEQKLILYRKGIRCNNTNENEKSLFLYDLPDFKINESRVITSKYDCGTSACALLATTTSEYVIKQILQKGYKTEFWEGGFYWRNYSIPGGRLSNTWKEVIGNKCIIVKELAGWFEEEQKKPHFIVTSYLAELIQQSFPEITIYGVGGEDVGVFRVIETTPKIEFLLKKAQDFLSEAKYPINYNIQIGKFSKDTQLGGINDGLISLSEKVFDMGLKEIVMTIIEENEHLNTGHKDCSRAFQNHFIKLYVTEMENRIGNFL